MKEDSDSDEDIHLQTENILKKINEQVKLSQEALNLNSKPKLEEVKVPDNSKSMILPKKENLHQNLFNFTKFTSKFSKIKRFKSRICKSR